MNTIVRSINQYERVLSEGPGEIGRLLNQVSQKEAVANQLQTQLSERQQVLNGARVLADVARADEAAKKSEISEKENVLLSQLRSVQGITKHLAPQATL